MSKGASGYDLFACIDEPLELKQFQRAAIPCGFALSIPKGFEAQVRPRSGWALKEGVTVLNTPGTIDSDYRGEITVILINFGEDVVKIEPMMRIAQLVFCRVEEVIFEECEALDETERSVRGFGHSGV